MKKIFWDKGHGGSDPGAVANGLQEKVLTHKIVEYATDYLAAHYEGFTQRVSREGDQSLTLDQRADMANKWGADVFVSVHINAGKGTGFEIYAHPNASPQSIALQNVLHDEILAAMRQFGNITDRGKKRANYAVLRETKMPAVLTENLFIDSNDAKHLKNEAFLKAVGEAHARGVAKFLGLKEKPKVQPKPEVKTEQKPSDGKLYRVQVGAFADRKNAERLAEELKKKGYPAIIV
ncbi:N-acetylmuramoyl-L-alanine amidase [Geobacillus stearothermophilus]|uniref:N-acetylmuramoyl-L-alanine amidase n=1 Tax=Geobacillus stearothermophilus TaxID=1422 RepID=UPI002E224AE7|nr:N-acetylmuramoyl-L-alanine amidase [Geobacillus stearothermophilus]